MPSSAVAVVAPAADAARGRERAGVRVAGADRRDAADDVGGGRRRPVVRRAVAELAAGRCAPQQRTPPAVISAQVCAPPAAIALTPVEHVGGSAARGRSVVVPSPSWPDSLAPQQRTPPPVISAQVCARPAAIAFDAREHGGGGRRRARGRRCRRRAGRCAFAPQQRTPPSVESAQVCAAPAATAVDARHDVGGGRARAIGAAAVAELAAVVGAPAADAAAAS